MQYALPEPMQRLVNAAVQNAHMAAQDARRPQPPIAIRGVPYGQTFMIDSAPQVLFARVRDDQPLQHVVPVVIISTARGQEDQLGRVMGLPPGQTVRLVDVVAPAQVVPL